MGLPTKVSRKAWQMKPAYGQPCNRCGACCEATPCDLAQHVLGLDRHSGRCPALSGEPGAATCGLIQEPGKWAPIRTAIHGTEAMHGAAILLVNAGDGCCSRINGEPDDHAFRAGLARLDRKRASKIRRARKLWE